MLTGKKEIDALISVLCQKKHYDIYKTQVHMPVERWQCSADWLHNIGGKTIEYS